MTPELTQSFIAIIGEKNERIDIAPGAHATFILEFKPNDVLTEDVQMLFDCANTPPAAIFDGLNTFGITSLQNLVADMVAIARTVTADGIVSIPGVGESAAFAVASSNIGIGDVITARVRSSFDDLALTLSLCETDPATAACVDAPNQEVVVEVDANGIPTFSVFVTANRSIENNPAAHRVVVEFLDA